VASRPPRHVDRQTIIDSELRRIRDLEKSQEKSGTRKNRTQKPERKPNRRKEFGADSNRNLTKDEEFILEHVTAFVFRPELQKNLKGNLIFFLKPLFF